MIPVHDSFIVWDIDGDDLLRAMTDAFKHVTKCPSNFPVFFRVESAYFPTEKVVNVLRRQQMTEQIKLGKMLQIIERDKHSLSFTMTLTNMIA